ncbi:aminoglycoside phosphotransferase family protein [Candidatus Thorarchaeota archaeon]|nr:MAG: aminoglycoside phosphotransferase family protein [Candidatus Thorarchaeota archaeon]
MFEENNPPDIDFHIVASLIKEHIPTIKESEIRFLYHGTHNVYDVREEFIFRFPSTFLAAKERKNLIHREALLLRELKSHLSVKIPSPEFVDFASENPHMGYRKIPGASLHYFYDNTPVEKRQEIGETLGRFLGELHKLDLNELADGKLASAFNPIIDYDEYLQFFQRIQKAVYPTLSKLQKEWTDTLFHDFLDDDENFHYVPCLTHCDFDTTNILINPANLEVTGIIDFEETRMYDPAADFLFQDEGIEFLTSMLRAYTGQIDSTLPQRMMFRLGRCPLIYILSGIDFKLEQMISYGYNSLKDMIENWDRYSSVLAASFANLKL